MSVCSYPVNAPQQPKAHGSVVFLITVAGKSKGKVQIRIGNEGPVEEWTFSSIISLTSALDEGLDDTYSSPNIVRVIKSRRMRGAGHVARMGERCVQGFGEET